MGEILAKVEEWMWGSNGDKVTADMLMAKLSEIQTHMGKTLRRITEAEERQTARENLLTTCQKWVTRLNQDPNSGDAITRKRFEGMCNDCHAWVENAFKEME